MQLQVVTGVPTGPDKELYSIIRDVLASPVETVVKQAALATIVEGLDKITPGSVTYEGSGSNAPAGCDLVSATKGLGQRPVPLPELQPIPEMHWREASKAEIAKMHPAPRRSRTTKRK